MKTIRISASQVETFRLCKRKWAFQKIDRLPSPQNAAAALGEEAHKHRENWLIHGIPPPADTKAGKLALAGLDQLPPPGLAEVEKQLKIVTSYDPDVTVDVTGRIDFFLPNQEPQKVWGELGVPLIGDHKTTAGEEWMKTAEVLTGGDPQGAIYAQYALGQTDAQAVDLVWAYMIKGSSPRAAQVRARMSKAQIDEQFGRVIDDARNMLAIIGQQVLGKDVEPTTTACEAFGGCPFRENCPITNQQKIGALMAQGALHDVLKLANAAPAAAPAPAAPASTPVALAGLTPAVTIAGLGMGSPPSTAAQAAVASMFAAPAPAPAMPAIVQPGPSTGSTNVMALRALIAQTPGVAAITATPAAAAPAAPAAAPALEAVLATPPPAVVLVAPPPALANPEAQSAVVPPDAPAADLEATGEEPKKKGRPKKTATLEAPDMSGAIAANLARIADALEKLVSKA